MCKRPNTYIKYRGSGGGGGFSKNPDTGTTLAPGLGTSGQGNNGGAAYYNSAGGGGGQGGGNHYSGTLQLSTSGTPNTGGGGGGNGYAPDSLPGSGGSGIVIIAYTP